MKIVNVAGARPNFVKIAPLIAAQKRSGRIQPVLVHTGQHYDRRMSDLFFRELEIPQPDVDLGVGSGSHADQTAQIMTAFEPVLIEQDPAAVLVVGDVNSTIACGLVAVKLGFPLIHVEAGLRSFDRSMPEEINRVLTDAIANLLFCTERSAVENLRREGIPDERTWLVGNVMIDTLLNHRDRADASTILAEMAIEHQRYAVLTLHRPANVDRIEVLTEIIDAVEQIAREIPVVFPIHPRTRASLERFALARRAEAVTGLHIIEPAGYLDFLKLLASASVVLTDSGGIQEETTILQVPCLTLRDSTERPITVELGSNRLVPATSADIVAAYRHARANPQSGQCPPLWDGKAAQRIVEIILEKLVAKP